MSHVKKILVDECSRFISLRYRKELEKAGYEILDLCEKETDPLCLGCSDEQIFNWAVNKKDKIAIITANRNDFVKLHNSCQSDNDVILLFVKKPQRCTALKLIQAFNYINTYYTGYRQISIPQVFTKMG